MSTIAVGVLVAPTEAAVALVEGWPVLLCDPRDTAGLWSAVPPGVSHVLVVAERRHAALAGRHAALLADRGLAVSRRTVPHGPAATLVMAFQTASARVDPGLLPVLLEAQAAATWSGAWLPTVARLEDPAPSLGQHLRSLVPTGAGYLAQLTAPAGVVPVGAPLAPDGAAPARTSLLAAGEGVPQAALDAVLAATGTSETVVLPGLDLDPLARFGTARAVELVAGPAYQPALPAADALPRCTVCGAAVAAELCTYCHVRPSSDLLDPRGAQ